MCDLGEHNRLKGADERMRILGIHDGHNATACLLEDGRIVAAQHEERLCRVKNWWGFPEQAIRLVLEMGGIKLGDVDIVAMNGHHMPYPKSRAETMEQYRQTSSADQQARRVLRRTIVGRLFTQKRKRERRADLRRMGVPDDRVLFVDHHDCHWQRNTISFRAIAAGSASPVIPAIRASNPAINPFTL